MLRRTFSALPLAAAAYGQDHAKLDPAKAGFAPDRLQRLTPWLQGLVDRREYAGINVAVARRGKIVYSESFGLQDIQANKPMRPDTIFRLFSMTKMITGVAAMTLYEEGKFLLDDPVAKFIPALEKVKVLAAENGSEVVDLKTPMRVKHLLTHTSGLSNDKAYRERQTFRAASLSEMLTRLPDVPLAHQPGAAWRYGQSLDVLAALVELWSGKPFDTYLEERIFRPLGMRDTFRNVPEEKLSRLSRSFVLNKQGELQQTPDREITRVTYQSGSGGLHSTAGDYMKLCMALQNGGRYENHRLLGRKTIEYMMKNHVPLNVIAPEGPNGRTGYGYGLGAAVLVDPAAASTLSAEGEYSWGGAAGTYFWIDRANDVSGVFMVQRPPFVHPPTKRLRMFVYQALEA